jgi:hypothetical protein
LPFTGYSLTTKQTLGLSATNLKFQPIYMSNRHHLFNTGE